MRALIVAYGLVLLACAPPGVGHRAADPNPDNDIDLLNDPVIAYRNGPGGFPIPEDAVAQGPAKFEVPRHYHQTARMQQAKLEQLGFAIETTRPSGWAYRLTAKKGDQTFVATIATPRGPHYSDSSTIEVASQ